MDIETLPEFIRKVISEALPLRQNTSADNLDFGWIYYALIQNLHPSYVVSIGSAMGFAPFSAVRAVHNNKAEQAVFINPGYNGEVG